jgi:hypothetical protein
LELTPENTALAGEKPAKQANLSMKINPACTSHTDRACGVDVLALPVAGAASDKFGEFLSRSLLITE